MKKILFIYTDWNANEERRQAKGYGGVAYYRVFKPAMALRKLGYEVTIVGEDLTNFGKTPEALWPTVFTTFDAVIVKQMDNPTAAAQMFFYSQQYDTPVILDLDDDYFSVKEDQPAWEHYKPGSQKRAIFAACLSMADAIFVSTQPLKDSYEKVLKDVYGMDAAITVLPNCTQISDWFVPEAAHVEDFFKKKHEDRKSKKVVIGYAGSITHNADLKLVIPAVLQVMRTHKNVHFEIMGALNKNAFIGMFGGLPASLSKRISLVGGTHSWQGYPEALNEKGWDIGIAPLVDDAFTRAKSHIKWMEYSMVGIPCVASPTYPYSEPVFDVPVIEDRKTGFHARSVDEWIVVLSELVTTPDLRHKIAANAFLAIQKNWRYDSWSKRWAEAIETVLCNFQTRREKLALSSNANSIAGSTTQESAAKPQP